MNWIKTSHFVLFSRTLVLSLLCLAAGYSLADDGVLARGEGATITTADVLSDLEHLPAELRQGILASPPKLEQLASKLYVRRVLAKRAREAGLDKTPGVIVALQLASDQILGDAMLAKAVTEAQPSNETALEKAARAYYAAEERQFMAAEERKVRHILIAKATENAEARAREVLEKLKHGADFAKLAKEYSDDPGTKNKGGDLGYFGRNRMVKPFEDAAFGLNKVGELAGPVETAFGWHVLRLDAIRAPGKKPYNEVSADIKHDVLEKIAQDRRIALADEIRPTIEFNRAAIESFAKQYQ
jgi:peptidyl-prolyl cis-trans isomerase C